MKINYYYPQKNNVSFTMPCIGCSYYNNSFSICVGFLFWAIEIEF